MYLHEIKIVDLTHSKWDKEKSDPKTGTYDWTDKVYINYKDKTVRPDHSFMWVLFDQRDGLKDVRDHQIKWGYSYVTPDDPYYPEGLAPDAEGRYRYGDVVLMKCKLLNYLLKRQAEKKMSRDASMSRFQSFKDSSKELGIALNPEDEEALQNLMKSNQPG